jgi:hypothetical protein
VIDILLDVLVPIFAVMGFGYFARWIRDVDNRHVSELNAPVIDLPGHRSSTSCSVCDTARIRMKPDRR